MQSILPDWELISTGGGCTALSYRISDTHYLMMTSGDPSAPESLDEPCTVGLYHRSHTEELMQAAWPSVREFLDGGLPNWRLS